MKTRVLGIDPGSTLMGYAIIEDEGDSFQSIAIGTLVVQARDPLQKLPELSTGLAAIIHKYRPVAAGIERLFFSKNKKTALEVAQARGVIALALLAANVEVLEIGPGEVKMLIAGYGKADKLAVAKMAGRLLNLSTPLQEDNAADAAAVAIATAMRWRGLKRLQ